MTEGSMMSSLGQQSMGSSAIGSDLIEQVHRLVRATSDFLLAFEVIQAFRSEQQQQPYHAV